VTRDTACLSIFVIATLWVPETGTRTLA